jgi:hypothetical protein
MPFAGQHPACNTSLQYGHINASGFDRALASLEAQWRTNGVYEHSPARFFMELLFTAGLIFASVRWSRRSPLLGGIMMGLAILAHFRQAHECGHEKGVWRPELWPSERLHSWALYLVVNLGAGVDGLVWQKEHRLHHAHTLTDRDPQIVWRPDALMPLCAVEAEPLAAFIGRHPVGSVLVRWQEATFMPTLMLVGKHFLALLSYRRIESASTRDVLARKLLLLGHYLLQAFAVWRLLWRARLHASRARKLRDCAAWLVGCSIAAGAIEPMFLFNHIQTGRSMAQDANDKVAQVRRSRAHV